MSLTLGLIAFGGNVHSGPAGSDPVVEIWESTLAMSVDDTVINQSHCDDLADLLVTWMGSNDAHLASTASLDYVKFNEYNLVSGRQVTDPTIQTLTGGQRGALTSNNPITTCYRVTLDDGTRNPRRRGGFYAPRLALDIAPTGRMSSGNVTAIASAMEILLDGINTLFTAAGAIGVWSRADHEVHVSTRFRIGDVPDNIRRRKNHLRETYLSVAL
jgi:phage gp37-like protein